jgi:hypothetical protein
MDRMTLRVSHRSSPIGPVARFRNLPGPEEALTPKQMRRLAEVLNHCAAECEVWHLAYEHNGPHEALHELDWGP